MSWSSVHRLPGLAEYAGYSSTIFQAHSISNLVYQIGIGALQTEGISDPAEERKANIISTTLAVSKSITEFALDAVERGKAYALDPMPASEYEVVSNIGSPPFEAVVLPYIPGVSSYSVSAKINDKWGNPVTVSPVQKFQFTAPTSNFKFSPVFNTKITTVMPEHFFFDVFFSSSGDFKGTLTSPRIPKGNKALPALLLLLD